MSRACHRLVIITQTVLCTPFHNSQSNLLFWGGVEFKLHVPLKFQELDWADRTRYTKGTSLDGWWSPRWVGSTWRPAQSAGTRQQAVPASQGSWHPIPEVWEQGHGPAPVGAPWRGSDEWREGALPQVHTMAFVDPSLLEKCEKLYLMTTLV